jgi:hypothetical protein
VKLHDRTKVGGAIASIVIGAMAAGCSATATESAARADVAPPIMRMTTAIPEEVRTPDRVETRLGTLNFFDGMPDDATVEKVYENLDFMRGVDVFLNFIPAASIEAMRRGMAQLDVTRANDVMVMDGLMDSKSLFLTGNTDTVYAGAFLDLQRDGPTVVEVPAGAGPGTVNDAYFRFVTDMGAPGPDRGRGGKYLILPPGYEGEVPEGYFVSESRSYVNFLILRGFLVDGKPDAAARMWRSSLRIYPLSRVDDPPAMKFVNGTGREFNTIHANNYVFFEELHTVIDREPADLVEPQLAGMAAAIGIQKGKPFAPDARMRAILEEAVAVGNATARAIWLKPRDRSAYLYEDSGWFTAFLGGDYRWFVENGEGARNLDARTLFFYSATVNTPAMALEMIGAGSQYAFNATDSDGAYLDGSRTYRLRVPADVPAKDFWSVVAYDPQTRSELQTDQRFPSVNNRKTPLTYNDDGSVDLYFGPEAPVGMVNNWVQTVPGKGWFVLLRLYGPLEPWFEKTWQPGEFERLD